MRKQHLSLLNQILIMKLQSINFEVKKKRIKTLNFLNFSLINFVAEKTQNLTVGIQPIGNDQGLSCQWKMQLMLQ